MTSNRAITIDLGQEQELLDAQLRSGLYDSASEVVRAALRALERESEGEVRARIQEALDDPSPNIPMEDVFADLRRYHAEQSGVSRRG
jgi:antitoxin ParD1/3/4